MRAFILGLLLTMVSSSALAADEWQPIGPQEYASQGGPLTMKLVRDVQRGGVSIYIEKHDGQSCTQNGRDIGSPRPTSIKAYGEVSINGMTMAFNEACMNGNVVIYPISGDDAGLLGDLVAANAPLHLVSLQGDNVTFANGNGRQILKQLQQ